MVPCTPHIPSATRAGAPTRTPAPTGRPTGHPFCCALLRDPVVDGSVLIGVEGRADRIGGLILALVLVLVLRAAAAGAAGSIAGGLELVGSSLERRGSGCLYSRTF